MLYQYLEGTVTYKQHILNIKDISYFSSNFNEIFKNGKINFVVAQKMLNLYLKNQWCLGNIGEPTHFPVDRHIQEKLIFLRKEITFRT